LYKLLLILKYLRTRRIAWVSLVAVTLCVAMVLVVISVMGGWLRMFRSSFHGMSGDVLVTGNSLSGFPYYQEIIDDVKRLPEVEQAVPVIQTFGLINIKNRLREGVAVMGIQLPEIGQVNRFADSLNLQWTSQVKLREETLGHALSAAELAKLRRELKPPSFDLLTGIPYEDLLPRAKNVRDMPGMIVGAGVVGIRKDEKGELDRPFGLYEAWAKLTVLGVSESASFDIANKSERNYWIVDDSRTQVWQYDANTVYVPFCVLQSDLGMAGETYIDKQTGEEHVDPPRCTQIQIKAREGTDLAVLCGKVDTITRGTFDRYNSAAGDMVKIETWDQNQAMWLNAIEKEKVLITCLFSLISVVAIFLIFCIFYMIVIEKTRDIGIVKSVGATNAGVAQIFLGYGLTIGLVGAGAGLGIGYLIVHNINQLHTWMGRAMGIQIWSPEVYAFDTIPNTMNPNEVAVILGVAVISSVLGALVPAMRAARMHPVEALRWE